MKNIEKFFFTHTIQIPSKVKIKKIENSLFFEGPLGLIEMDICKMDSLGLGFFRINAKLNQIEIFVKKNSKNSKAFFGSLLSLYKNNIHGVCQGFLVYLELVGVGFRAVIHEFGNNNLKSEPFVVENTVFTPERIDRVKPSVQENSFLSQKIELKVGQSHEIVYFMPKNNLKFISNVLFTRIIKIVQNFA